MTESSENAMLMASLSIYKGIMNRTVVKAFAKLLSSLNSEPSIFLDAYSEFFAVLSQRGYSTELLYCLTQAALFDENCFTRAAAAGNADSLAENVKLAAMTDCRIIMRLGRITPERLLADYKYYGDIKSVVPLLPKWEAGSVVPPFASEKGLYQGLIDFHRENGCGMFARYKAFIWRGGSIEPVLYPDKIEMSGLKGYEYQRNLVVNNTKAFLEGKSCNNCLLYGDKGTGKSSTVKAIVNRFYGEGLRIVEIPKERLMDFPILVDKIAAVPMKFIIFIDDLSFQKQDESYASLKAVLEGGLAARPDNALIYATSNRRHLVKESFADRDTDDVNRRDNMQESLSLSDRFGLSVCFSIPSKDQYLEIVEALAERMGITLDKEELINGAERFALERGGRSPRCAKQYIESLNAELTEA